MRDLKRLTAGQHGGRDRPLRPRPGRRRDPARRLLGLAGASGVAVDDAVGHQLERPLLAPPGSAGSAAFAASTISSASARARLQRPGGGDRVADALGLRAASAPRAGRAPPARGSRSRARISGSVTVPSSRSVPRCLPVRSAGPGDVEHVVEQLEREPDRAPEARRAAPRRRRPPSAPSRQAASNSRAVLRSQRAQVALARDRRVPRVLALQQLALRERARTRRRARAPPRRCRRAASSANARENSRSPVAVAIARPAGGHDRRRGRAAAAPRRARRRARASREWTSSTATAARSTASRSRGAGPAATNTSSGRSRLPPAAIVAPACSASTGAVRARELAPGAPRAAPSAPATCAPPASMTAATDSALRHQRATRARVQGDDAARGQDPAHVDAGPARGQSRRRAPAGPGKRLTELGR